MAHYYITDAFSTWNVADPAFPEELPCVGEYIYVAVVDGPIGQKSAKPLSQVMTQQYRGIEWLKDWYKTLRSNSHFGPDATIIWIKKPPKPLLPMEWKICGPTVCEDHLCDGYDDGYCMSENSEHCPKAKIHKEFSIIRHAEKPSQSSLVAEIPDGNALDNADADSYNLIWRNAFVYWVDWEARAMRVQIGSRNQICYFNFVQYSATDDTQAIKMILDRLVVNMYRVELALGGASIELQKYVANILAKPYEWNISI